MRSARAAAVACVALLAAALALSGGRGPTPRLRRRFPGMPAPFLGTALIGEGETVGAVDAYGDVVDLRRLGPAGAGAGADPGRAPGRRHRAGRLRDRRAGRSERRDASILARRRGPTALPARDQRAADGRPVRRTARRPSSAGSAGPVAAPPTGAGCAASRPLGGGAPRLGAADVPALAARPPRPHRPPHRARDRRRPRRLGLRLAARRRRRSRSPSRLPATGPRRAASSRFLERLDLGAAARFDVSGAPVDGRAAQGDAAGWVRAAARAVGIAVPACTARPGGTRPTTRRKAPATTSATRSPAGAGARRDVLRGSTDARGGPGAGAGEPGSGLDAAAAWAVRPFPHPGLFPAARRTLLRLVAGSGRFGITPSEDWPDDDPWTAPTAWCAWSLAALGERRAALRLMAELRRAATPARPAPGAGRRPHRHPALDHAARLVPRLRDPRPPRALA